MPPLLLSRWVLKWDQHYSVAMDSRHSFVQRKSSKRWRARHPSQCGDSSDGSSAGSAGALLVTVGAAAAARQLHGKPAAAAELELAAAGAGCGKEQ